MCWGTGGVAGTGFERGKRGGGGSGDLNRGPYWPELSREPTSQVALASESLPTHPLTQKLRSAPGNEYHFHPISMKNQKEQKVGFLTLKSSCFLRPRIC